MHELPMMLRIPPYLDRFAWLSKFLHSAIEHLFVSSLKIPIDLEAENMEGELKKRCKSESI